MNNQKSFKRYSFFFKGMITSWYNKYQQIISISIFEALYMVIGHDKKKSYLNLKVDK